MRNTFIATVVLIVVFVALRLVWVITPGCFLGLGVIFVVLGVFLLFALTGVKIADEGGLPQLGGMLLTLGIVLLIVSWFLGG